MLLTSINTTIIDINAETQPYDQTLCSSNDDSMVKNDLYLTTGYNVKT